MKLYVEMALPERPARRLANRRKRLRGEIVERLALLKPRLEFGCFGLKCIIRERLKGVLKRIYLAHDGLSTPQSSRVFVAKYLRPKRHIDFLSYRKSPLGAIMRHAHPQHGKYGLMRDHYSKKKKQLPFGSCFGKLIDASLPSWWPSSSWPSSSLP